MNVRRFFAHLFSPPLFYDLYPCVLVPVCPKAIPVHVCVHHGLDDPSEPNLDMTELEDGSSFDRHLLRSIRVKSRRRHPRRNAPRCISAYVWSTRYAETCFLLQPSIKTRHRSLASERILFQCVIKRWKQWWEYLTNNCKQAISEQLWEKRDFTTEACFNLNTAVRTIEIHRCSPDRLHSSSLYEYSIFWKSVQGFHRITCGKLWSIFHLHVK